MVFRQRLIAISAAFFLLLPSLGVAASVIGIVDTTAKTVTRANFLSWSFTALDIPKTDGTCRLPYTRVPRGLKQTLCAAEKKGALNIFGRAAEYPLNRMITRGEVLELLTALTDKHESSDISGFKDVKTDAQKKAVMNAVALKWMVPQSATLFGLTQPLTGIEALSVLQAASSTVPVKVHSITVPRSLPSSGDLPHQDLLDAVYALIKRDYIHADTIDTNEAAYRAIEGMVQSLNDPYSTFFRPANADDFQSQIKGEISGIGAQVEDKAGIITVVSPIPGSPADRAGIRAGDEILEAGGVVLKGLGVDKAVSHIRGQRGTTVLLKLRRGGIEMDVTVTRDTISLPEIQTSWQGDIAVVQLVQFGETTVKRIRSVFTDISAENPRGIVLDLRNNGGGLLTAADIVMSNFVPRGTVVAKVKSRSNVMEEKTEDEPTVQASTKLVVLVNKGSASASEIVAGALQDWKRATIVGAVTFGKGTVQEIIGFRTGEALKLTIAEWLTPLGRHIDKVGVVPDVIVDSENRDEQLRKALDILR